MKLTNINIWLTENCNLSCDYCYETHTPVSLNLDKVTETINKLFMSGNMDLQAEKHIISFYGGEPLLEFEGMQEIINWLEENIPRPFIYSITTNGTLITAEIAAYLKEKNFAMLFSIDGDEDAMQARSDSHSAAVAGFQHLIDIGMTPEANMTFTPEQLSRGVTNVQHVIDLGFIYYNLNPREDVMYNMQDVYNAFMAIYTKHINEWQGQGVRTSALSQPFRRFLGIDTGHGCGAGKGFVALSPTGEIYPCHHLVQEKGLQLSQDGYLYKTTLKSWWESFNPLEGPECKKCLINQWCPGHCAAASIYMTGDLHSPWKGACNFKKGKLLAAQNIFMQLTESEQREVAGIVTS